MPDVLGEHAGQGLPYRTLRRYCGGHAQLLILRPHTPDMKSREDVPQDRATTLAAFLAVAELAKARPRVHTLARAFVRLRAHALFFVALLCQIVILWAAGELVDLYVSSVELWAELARKHLELTM